MQSTSSYQCPSPNTNPGPTVIVQEPGQVSTNNVSAAWETPQKMIYSDRFNGRAGRATGVVQVCCGIGAIIFGIAQIALDSLMIAIGTGIWSAVVFFIPCGIVGIFTLRKSTCVIIAYMVMSILAAIDACITLLIIGTVYTVYDYDCLFSSFRKRDCTQGSRIALLLIDIIMVIIGLIEMLTAIAASCYCCVGVCRFNTSTTTTHVVTQRTPLIGQQEDQVSTSPPSVQLPPSYSIHTTRLIGGAQQQTHIPEEK